MCEGSHYTPVVKNFQDRRLKLHRDQILLACSGHHVKCMVLQHNEKKESSFEFSNPKDTEKLIK